jgi:hypothetical protein
LSKISDLNLEKAKRDPSTIKLKMLSDDIDSAILHAVRSGIDPVSIAAVVLNRFIEASRTAEIITGQQVTDTLLSRFTKKDDK